MLIGTDLDTLEAKGLIRLAQTRPELEYLFRHSLVQDAAYGSLLKQERRQLHRLVGDALEDLYPDRHDELAAVLALHFEHADDTERAIGYLMVAGQYGLDRNAIAEAYEAYDRALRLLPAPTPDEGEAVVRRRLQCGVGRSRAGYAFRAAEEQIAQIEEMLPSAERLGDLDLLAQLHLARALTRLQAGELPTDPEVKRSLDRIDEIGEALSDPSLRALQLAIVGLNQVFVGPIRDGVAALEEAVPVIEARSDFVGAAFARGALAMGYAGLGEFDRAEAALRHALELSEGGDLIAKLDARIAEAWVRSLRGQLDEAAPLAEACVADSETTGAVACGMVSSWLLGDVYHRQGRTADAQRALARGTELAMIVDRKVWRPTLQAWLSTSTATLGAAMPEGGWDEALDAARAIGNRVGEAEILGKRAEAHASRGDLLAALADDEASIALLEDLGAKPDLARTLRRYGDTLDRVGRHDDGRAALERARDLLDAMGIDAEARAITAVLEGTRETEHGG